LILTTIIYANIDQGYFYDIVGWDIFFLLTFFFRCMLKFLLIDINEKQS